jgi:hypothetical protein
MKVKIYFTYYLLALIFLLSVNTSLKANINDSLNKCHIGFIGHLNNDEHSDAIYCKKINSEDFMPFYILWGQDYSDSTTTNLFTEITYPDWDEVTGNYSVFKYDNDTIFDIALFYKGKKINNNNIVEYDRAYVIFGYDDLKNIRTINMSEIDQYEDSLFISRVFSDKIKDGKSRDNSRRKSYILEKFNNNRNARIPNAEANILIDGNLKLNIYPNPAKDNLNIEISGKAKCDIILNIFTSQSSLVYSSGLLKKEQSDLIHKVNLRNFTSGIYLVTANDLQGNVLKEKFVVIK